MGILDITIGGEDQNELIGVGLGAFLGPVGMAAGYTIADQINRNNREQAKAIAEQEKAMERARYETLLHQVSAEIQADQSVLATLDSGGDNKTTGVNTQQNQEVGSMTSGTF